MTTVRRDFVNFTDKLDILLFFILQIETDSYWYLFVNSLFKSRHFSCWNTKLLDKKELIFTSQYHGKATNQIPLWDVYKTRNSLINPSNTFTNNLFQVSNGRTPTSSIITLLKEAGISTQMMVTQCQGLTKLAWTTMEQGGFRCFDLQIQCLYHSDELLKQMVDTLFLSKSIMFLL